MLTQTFYGTTLLLWGAAIGVALLTGVALLGARTAGLHWLSARAPAHPRALKWPLAVLDATRPLFLAVIAIFVGAQLVELPPKIDRFIDHVAIVAVIAQGALWASDAIKRTLARQVEAKRLVDASAATTVAVLGFCSQLVLWSVVLLLVLENLGFNITTLLAGLGIGGIAVALAAQNILGDLFASVTIALDKPFAIGDFITTDSIMGSVEYVGLKTTRLRSLTGEQIILANTELLKSKIRNYKRLQERRIEFTLDVAAGTPSDKLKAVPTIIREAIAQQTKTRFERAHLKTCGAPALTFEAAFYVQDPDYNRYMDIQQEINLAILRGFEREGIALKA